jgi:hypothetical protein
LIEAKEMDGFETGVVRGQILAHAHRGQTVLNWRQAATVVRLRRMGAQVDLQTGEVRWPVLQEAPL